MTSGALGADAGLVAALVVLLGFAAVDFRILRGVYVDPIRPALLSALLLVVTMLLAGILAATRVGTLLEEAVGRLGPGAPLLLLIVAVGAVATGCVVLFARAVRDA